MTSSSRPTRPRPTGLLVVTGVAVVLTVLSGARATHVGRTLLDAMSVGATTTTVDVVESGVAVLVMAAGAMLGAWHSLSGLALAACAIARRAGRGRRWERVEKAARLWAPPLIRQLGAAALGAAVAAGAVVGPAAASTAPPDDLRWSAPEVASTAHGGSGQALPEGATASGGAQEQAGSRPTAHRVRAGDSLWTIAAAAVAGRGEEPTAAAVAVEWPRWYATNRDLIGPDPGLIHPGQLLTAPVPPPEEGPRS